MVSQRLWISTVPAFCIVYVLPLSLCLSNEAKQGWHNEERRMKANLWFCGITVFVGFYLCSQMWWGFLSAHAPPLKALAVTLLTPHVSSLFLVLQLCLTEVHLKRIYKRQEIVSCRWKDIKCTVWVPVWTGLVLMPLCTPEIYLAERAEKHKIILMNVLWALFKTLQCDESKCEAGLRITGAIPHAELSHSHACMCHNAHTCTQNNGCKQLLNMKSHSTAIFIYKFKGCKTFVCWFAFINQFW